MIERKEKENLLDQMESDIKGNGKEGSSMEKEQYMSLH